MRSLGNYMENFIFSNVYSNDYNRKGQLRVSVRINKGKVILELSPKVHMNSLQAKPNDKKVGKFFFFYLSKIFHSKD